VRNELGPARRCLNLQPYQCANAAYRSPDSVDPCQKLEEWWALGQIQLWEEREKITTADKGQY
jgi:hypothetical protein